MPAAPYTHTWQALLVQCLMNFLALYKEKWCHLLSAFNFTRPRSLHPFSEFSPLMMASNAGHSSTLRPLVRRPADRNSSQASRAGPEVGMLPRHSECHWVRMMHDQEEQRLT